MELALLNMPLSELLIAKVPPNGSSLFLYFQITELHYKSFSKQLKLYTVFSNFKRNTKNINAYLSMKTTQKSEENKLHELKF